MQNQTLRGMEETTSKFHHGYDKLHSLLALPLLMAKDSARSSIP